MFCGILRPRLLFSLYNTIIHPRRVIHQRLIVHAFQSGRFTVPFGNLDERDKP